MFGFECGCLLIKIVGLVMMLGCWMLLRLVIAFRVGWCWVGVGIALGFGSLMLTWFGWVWVSLFVLLCW